MPSVWVGRLAGFALYNNLLVSIYLLYIRNTTCENNRSSMADLDFSAVTAYAVSPPRNVRNAFLI